MEATYNTEAARAGRVVRVRRRHSQNKLEKSNELSCIYHKLKKIFYRSINDIYMDVQFAILFSILIKQLF